MIIQLTDYQPPVREDPDDADWSSARVEWAPAADPDDWRVLQEAFPLDPPVADPLDPPVYSWSIDAGPDWASGSRVRVVWIDEDLSETATDPYVWLAPPAWMPSVADVAALLRARLHENFGERRTTFTSSTNPTAQEVQALVAMMGPLVEVRTGALDALACPQADVVRKAAATIVAIRVAGVVEASYRPEELSDNRTVEAQLTDGLADDLSAVVTAAADCRAYDPSTPDETAGEVAPAWFSTCQPPLRW